MHEKRTVLITGGGQGIGKCLARDFLRAGYRVAIAELDKQAGEEAEQEYDSLGEISFFQCDIANEESVCDMLGAVLSRFGRLDVLINNAGIMLVKPLEKLTLEEWNRVMATNLTGAFLCVKHAAPHFQHTRGQIINLASTRALMSEPDTLPYSASKGGLVALTHALAVSLGPEIRVNCISPGWIEVSAWKKHNVRHEPQLNESDHLQHPSGRVGQPEDVARLALFLAAPENAFITGANFVVDGGMTRKMIYA